MFSTIIHWISQIWIDPNWYNFVSGPLPDITLLGGVVLFYKKHNCHISGCWRVARHPVRDTAYVVCRKHHPDIPDKITTDHVNGSVPLGGGESPKLAEN